MAKRPTKKYEAKRHHIDHIKQAKQKNEVKNATVNRMTALFRAILNRAKNEWEWIENVPKIADC